MHASNFGERKLTGLDFNRLWKLTAAGAMPQLAHILNKAQVVSARTIAGVLFQPEAAGDYLR